MKQPYFIIVIFFLCSLFNLEAKDKLQDILQKKDASFWEIQKSMNDDFDSKPTAEKRGWKQFKRWEYFWEQRLYPNSDFPNSVQIYKDAYSFDTKNSKNKIQSNSVWNNLGPFEPPQTTSAREQGVGRVNIVRFNPADELDLWIGAASGGLWRSKNGGNTWINYPYFNFLSLGVTDIGISKSNPNIIYVTTGDADGTIGTANSYYTIGIVKSTDGGNTWNITNFSKELSDKRTVTRILVNPTNPDIAIVGASDGIYKTTDGGNTWVNKTFDYSIIDLEYKPNDSNVIYAASYGFSGKNYIVKSTDGGETWKSVLLVSGSNRLNIEVSPANPASVYCLASNSSGNSFNSINISIDEGATWETTASVASTGNILGWYDGKGSDNGGQGMYDLSLAVSPVDESTIFVGGVNIWKSTDLGMSMTLNTHWYGYFSKPFVHADIHDLRFSPSGKRLYACNDGGISFTANGGYDWIDISNGLNITQFYRMSSSDLYPNQIVGGCQDNGTSAIINGQWTHLYSGDGMECLSDPTNPNRIFVSLYYGEFYRTNNGGNNFSLSINRKVTSESAGWVTPFVCNPLNSNTLFCGHQNVWRNQSGGDNGKWKKISNFGSSQVLQSLAVAPSDSNTIYAANYSDVFATYDGGTTWSSIYKSNSTAITYICVDPINPKRIWITKSGYSFQDKVYEYDGQTWKNLSGNLPNVPTNTIVYQKNSPDRIYVGTDIGVFYSDYSSGYWERFGDGLPNVIVLELEIDYSSKVMLRAATYGRGIWETQVMDCNLPEPQVNITGDLEFCEGKSVTLELVDNSNDFIWSTGETTRSITVSKSGTYSVILTNSNGCKAKSRGIIVKVNPNKDLNVTSSTGHFALCGNETEIELRASLGFDTYLWSNGATGRKLTISDPGDYTVTGTTSAGCVTVSQKITIQKGEYPEKPTITRDGNMLTSSDAFAYQWFKDEKEIKGATNKTYTLLEDDLGSFTVEAYNESGCSTFSDTLNITTGIDENQNLSKSILISPNPNSGNFTCEFNNLPSGPTKLEIIDMTGKVVFVMTLDSFGNNKVNLNLNNLDPGNYILRINVHNEIFSEKWIKN